MPYNKSQRFKTKSIGVVCFLKGLRGNLLCRGENKTSYYKLYRETAVKVCGVSPADKKIKSITALQGNKVMKHAGLYMHFLKRYHR